MIAAAENPVLRPRMAPLTPAQYRYLVEHEQLSNDVEYLNGALIEKMPKSPKHEKIIMKLLAALQLAVRPEYLLRKEGPITIGNSEPEPDISIVLGTIDDFSDNHPQTAEVVIEVAVSSYEIDLAKAEIYARGGVKEYIIIDATRKIAVLMREPNDGRYTDVREFSERLELRFAGIQIQLEKVW